MKPMAEHERGGLRLLTSLDGYRPGWLPKDIVAGVLITALAVPLSMGMAEVAGLPPIVGLYSCILPLVAFALLGSSRRLVIALDASTAAMLAAAIAPLAHGDPARYLALATTITFLVGLILILAGLGRLGVVANLLSRPVLLGYQAGIAIVVIAVQLPHLLGVDPGNGSTVGTMVDAVRAVGWASAPTIVLSALCLSGMTFLLRWRPSWPAAVIAVAAATLGVTALGLAGVVEVVGDLPSGLPGIRLPGLRLADVSSLIIPAAAIALVAGADGLVTARAFAARNAEEIDANRDLLGLGAANVASAVSGGITTSASAARTAVAESVGSHSQVAGLVAAATMLLVLLFFTGLLSDVPNAALASVVVLAVARLIEVSHLRRVWAIRRTEFAIAVTTFASVVTIGVLPAILVAMVLSLGDAASRKVFSTNAVLSRVRGWRGFHDVGHETRAIAPGRTVMIYRLEAPLFFANAERFRTRIRQLLVSRPDVSLVVVDAARMTTVDVTAAEIVIELERELADRGIRMVLAGLLEKPKETLDRAGALDAFGPAGIAGSTDEAVRAQVGSPSRRSME